jgi:hypothetical protein
VHIDALGGIAHPQRHLLPPPEACVMHQRRTVAGVPRTQQPTGGASLDQGPSPHSRGAVPHAGTGAGTSGQWARSAPTASVWHACATLDCSGPKSSDCTLPSAATWRAHPAETVLSIAAEIVADRCGGSGRPLRGTDATIHHDRRPVLDLDRS